MVIEGTAAAVAAAAAAAATITQQRNTITDRHKFTNDNFFVGAVRRCQVFRARGSRGVGREEGVGLVMHEVRRLVLTDGRL